ncbi:DUF362 domain-containing protein [Intestinibacter sp.]
MNEIYHTKESRMALEVFQMYEGKGEYFDLSSKPIKRETFYLGKNNQVDKESGYFITDKCEGCEKCCNICPQKCIDNSKNPFYINKENCIHCGNCMEVCPYGAVEKR